MDIDIQMEMDNKIEDLIQECLSKSVSVVLQRIDEDSSLLKLSDFGETIKHTDRLSPGENYRKKPKNWRERKPKLHPCSICPRVFDNTNALKAHINKHENNYIFCQEPNCTEIFNQDTQKEKIEFHKYSHQIPRFQYHWNRKECPFCKKVFNHSQKRMGHIMTVHKPGFEGFKCKFCEKILTNGDGKRRHERRHLETFKCSQCKFTTKSPDGLNNHIKTKHMVYKCQYLGCNLTFTKRIDFDKHKAEKHDEKYICKICFKVFHVKSSFQNHMSKYHNKQLRCDFEGCDEIFVTEEKFAKHKAEHDPLAKPSFECKVCLRLFWTKSKRNAHSKIHLLLEENKCSIEGCTKSFCTTPELKNHLKSHEKNKSTYSYGCSECGKIFKYFDRFQVHMENELNPKKFICDYQMWDNTGQCGKECTNAVGLKLHQIRTHGKNISGLHKCRICMKSYNSLKSLNDHMDRVHKKEKNLEFKCTFEGCFDSFGMFKVLQKHILKVHSHSQS